MTGGLGGVGRAVLPGLGIRMLVVGRGPARDLAELGPDAQYARVDVADADALEAAVAAAEASWGEPLAGVLHLAGVYESTQLADTHRRPVAGAHPRQGGRVEGRGGGAAPAAGQQVGRLLHAC